MKPIEIWPGSNGFAFGPGGEQLRLSFDFGIGGPTRLVFTAHYHGSTAKVRLGHWQAMQLRDVLVAALELVNNGGYMVPPMYADKTAEERVT